jgi:hypothetical protein
MGFIKFDIARYVHLLINAMAILNEKRFLNKFGIVPPNGSGGASSPTSTNNINNGQQQWGDFGLGNDAINNNNQVGESNGFKAQLAQLLFSVRLLLRWPIVIGNLVMIVLTILFG